MRLVPESSGFRAVHSLIGDPAGVATKNSKVECHVQRHMGDFLAGFDKTAVVICSGLKFFDQRFHIFYLSSRQGPLALPT